jgi:hypothetical protein
MLFAPLKKPPAKTFLSARAAIDSTGLFAFGLNESANPVVGSSRAMRLRDCPPMLLAPSKAPLTKILPSTLPRDGIDLTVRVRVKARVERCDMLEYKTTSPGSVSDPALQNRSN